MLDELVDPGSARAAAKAGAQFGEILDSAGGDYLNITIFGIANPASQVEFAGLAMHEPPESYTLDATAN